MTRIAESILVVVSLLGIGWMAGEWYGRSQMPSECQDGWVIAKREGSRLTCWHEVQDLRRPLEKRNSRRKV